MHNEGITSTPQGAFQPGPTGAVVYQESTEGFVEKQPEREIAPEIQPTEESIDRIEGERPSERILHSIEERDVEDTFQRLAKGEFVEQDRQADSQLEHEGDEDEEEAPEAEFDSVSRRSSFQFMAFQR